MKYRVGKKQNRVVLDENELVVVEFPIGSEKLAAEYCEFKNKEEDEKVENCHGGVLSWIDVERMSIGLPPLSTSPIRPSHYGGSDNPYEARKVIDAWGLDFNLGNVLKYVNRHTKKGAPIEDLKKAHQYLTFAIEKIEGV